MNLLPGVQLDVYEWRGVESLRLRNGERWRLVNWLVQDERQCREAFDWLDAHDELAYDTEGSGLHPHLGARVCGHVLTAKSGERELTNYYLPVRHQNTVEPQLDPKFVAGLLRQLLSSRPRRLRGHHLKFDALMGRADGVDLTLAEWLDSALAAVANDENEPYFKLKELTQKYVLAGAKNEEDDLDRWLKRDARSLGLNFKKRGRVDEGELSEPTYLERYGYARAPVPLLGVYGCHDGAYSWWLHDYFAPRVRQFGALLRRETSIAVELLEMEWHGLDVDVEEIRRADALMRDEITYWRAQVQQLAGTLVPDVTAKTLKHLLYEQLAMLPPKLTENDQPSADKEARLLLAKKYPKYAGLLRAIDKWAVAEKIHSTYAGTWLQYVSPQHRVHSAYNQLEQREEEGGVPQTGRLASSSPNAQNVAKKPIHLSVCACAKCLAERRESGREPGRPVTVSVRRYYVVPRGFVRVFIDLSQIEIRVLAWFTQDPVLLHCYAHNLDVHQITADAACDGNRDIGKIVGLGIQYGMTKIGLAKRLPNYADDPDGAEADAERFLAGYDAKYAGVPRFRSWLVQHMRANGNSFVNPFGRPRRIDAIASPDKGEFSRALRMAMSSIVSGTSADLNKEIILITRDVLREWYGHKPVAERGRQVQTIHDENIYDLPIAGCGPVIHALHRCYEDWPMFEQKGVPILANVEASVTSWEDKRPLKLLPDGMFEWGAAK